MTLPPIQGLQDFLNSDYQDALLHDPDGVVLLLDSGGQESLTFFGAQNGDTLTATASFKGLSTPTFSGFSQAIKHTISSALKTATAKAVIGSGPSSLQVSIDTKSNTLTLIELDVDPQLSRLLADPNLPASLSLSGANLSLAIDPQQKSYTLEADISGEWAIVKGFSLDSLGLTVTGTASASPAFNLTADVEIASVKFPLSAARAAASGTGGGEGGDYARAAASETGEGEEGGGAAPGWKFSGELTDGQTISLSGMITDLGGKLGVTLPSFVQKTEVTLKQLSVDFETGTKDFSFTSAFEGTDSSTLDIDLEIGADEGSVLFTYHNPQGESIDINSIVTAVSPELGKIVPSMSISLQDAVFVRTGGDTSKLFFGLDIAGGIDLSSLSGLPIVGSELSGDKTVKLSYQIVAASADFADTEVQALQKQLGDKYTTVPVPIAQGVSVASLLKIGVMTEKVDLSLSVDDGQVKAGNGSGAHWFKVEKTFGPVHLDQVGVQYGGGKLELLLKANMALGGLSISLDGLGIGSDLSPVKPVFQLDGMGIAYTTDCLEIAGAFRQRKVQNLVEYDGAAVIEAEVSGQKLGLHAIGSYADYKGNPSLFLYAFLDYPLGGLPFFFVEGLAAGFGYNRALNVPDIDGILDFPLVQEAVSGTGSTTTTVADQATALTKELDKLDDYIPLHVGAGFLAIGVKFSSFKMLDTFALLTVELGNRFEVDLLGVSDLVIPTPTGVETVDPLAELRMVLKLSFVPADGCIGLAAALDKSSYILSKQCTLSGGFARYAWFAGDHAGDFVVTLGGYHPAFEVPSHYPQIPRLGFNWRVDDSIVIKGDAYFALCSHALMAGGNLDASYRVGKVHASFSVGADFLISWLPYHYDIDAHVRISAGYGHLTAHVGADLHVWGPAFGGKAKIKIVIVKVTIKFGDQGSTSAAPIDWDKLNNAFLPANDKMCGITVQSGLVRKLNTQVDGTNEDVYVVNPKQFAFATDAFFPTNKAIVGETDQDIPYTPFGIRPMGVTQDQLTSQHTVTITHESGSSWASCESWFTIQPLRKKAASGLWGNPVVNGNQLQPPSVNEPQFVVENGQDPVSGFQIIPAKPPTPGASIPVDRSALQYDTDVINPFYQWQTLPLFQPSTDNDTARRTTLRKTIAANPTRDKILSALGYDPARDVQIDPLALDASLVFAPQVA